MISPFNIYMIGVGGQGIGLLSETLLRAADYAGYEVIGVDTHGLAQRGGTVSSHLRLGKEAKSPLIKPGNADLVIALERYEAHRALIEYSKIGSILVYYDAVWQPLNVRLQKDKLLKEESLVRIAMLKKVSLKKVYVEDLSDSRMQNVAILSFLNRNQIIEKITQNDYLKAMYDILPEHIVEKNIKLFESTL
ncbi:MAG: 2-oxoacid:acceptor oxidoreductase family protein [Candidatus Cloacimonetes bacterium]|jgi:indolepyruvate ferredoxin oxidoreductase beta subunit|nr:2-oxoacid:acceptor oxidoreductase family protein [Candidatus Cloacimonadota bacterium]